MPVRTDKRKARFRAALAIRGMTQREWAELHDLSPEHVSMVVNGRRESRRLIQQVEEFTAQHLRAA